MNIKVFLIRHGRQNSSLCNVNVELSTEGRRQSELLGIRLCDYDIDGVYSSNLIRAIETAEIIRNQLEEYNEFKNNNIETNIEDNIETNIETNIEDNIENEIKSACIHTDNEQIDNIDEGVRQEYDNHKSDYIYEGIKEIDFGELTGLTDEDINKKFGKFFNERELFERDIPFPKGENGFDVFERMNIDMNKIINHAAEHRYRNIAVVSHGGAIRAYLAGILNMPQQYRFLIAKSMENTSITELNFNVEPGDNKWIIKKITIERINDYSHIEGHDELLRKHFK